MAKRSEPTSAKFAHPEGPTDFQDTVGPRIAELRKDMSQAALAAAIGIDRSAMSRIESGERAISLSELVRISAELGVEPTGLLQSEEPVFAMRSDNRGGHLDSALTDCIRFIDDYLALEAAAG
jgi:transcriptional regulator with XRE-family HTH domain